MASPPGPAEPEAEPLGPLPLGVVPLPLAPVDPLATAPPDEAPDAAGADELVLLPPDEQPTRSAAMPSPAIDTATELVAVCFITSMTLPAPFWLDAPRDTTYLPPALPTARLVERRGLGHAKKLTPAVIAAALTEFLTDPALQNS